MRAVVLCLAVAVLAVVTACAQPADPSPEASYDPKPDAQLNREIAALPGYDRGAVRYDDGFGHQGYGGTVHVQRGADAAQFLDRVLAIMWQGRPGETDFGTIFVAPAPGEGPRLNGTLVGLSLPGDYEARYGDRPGTGEPPADAPPLRVQE